MTFCDGSRRPSDGNRHVHEDCKRDPWGRGLAPKGKPRAKTQPLNRDSLCIPSVHDIHMQLFLVVVDPNGVQEPES